MQYSSLHWFVRDNTSATTISQHGIDEMLPSLVEETRVPGGNHRPHSVLALTDPADIILFMRAHILC